MERGFKLLGAWDTLRLHEGRRILSVKYSIRDEKSFSEVGFGDLLGHFSCFEQREKSGFFSMYGLLHMS